MHVDIMAKKMLIDATHAEETRVVVVDGNKVEEFDFESQKKRQLAGNIYLAKITRVEPSLQAAFVDYGGNRHGFLAFSEVHPDYYQIPVADREALMAEEKAYTESMAAEAEREDQKPKRNRRRRSKTADQKSDDPVKTREVESADGMETIDIEGSEVVDVVIDVISDDLVAAGEALRETDVLVPIDIDANSNDDDEDQYELMHENGIESVAQEDDSDDMRPLRKPRPRRYKIQEVIKVRQILLIQVVKEERGNKGAALTTYLSLAGRYCVLMPNTARGGGISRKITNIADRKKLKEIATSIEVPDGAGLIVRTAGAKRTKSEIKRDYEYLQRMWEQIRALTLKSSAPAAIYEEGDLIKRSIRDLYNRDIDEILVEGAVGYRNAKDTMKMIMPSHAKNVKHYVDGMPLFARFQVEAFMDGMFNPTVQLKSGGYLVIGITEALVAIDVNSGRATKEGSIEQTALNTNLEAAEEVARQVRLRDLAGLIVIDFIDMEERRNNSAVEKRMKEKLKTDRARIQVGRISGFGLMEMSRQRLRPGMLEASTQPCVHCHGTGLIRSEDSLGLTILRELEEEGVRRRSKEVLVKAPISIANFLINQKREHIGQIEQRHGMAIRIESDAFLISPDFVLEKFKTATRAVPEAKATVGSIDITLMEEIDDEDLEVENEEVSETVEEAPKKKRRRRRRRRGGNSTEENGDTEANYEIQVTVDSDSEAVEPKSEVVTADVVVEEETPKRRRRSRGSVKFKADQATSQAETTLVESEVVVHAPFGATSESIEAEVTEEKQPEKPKRVRKPRKTKAEKKAEEAADANEKTVEVVGVEAAPVEKPVRKRKPKIAQKKTLGGVKVESDLKVTVAQEPTIDRVVEVQPKVVTETKAPEPVDTPKKRGWWSRG
jgi:ribonuclease E